MRAARGCCSSRLWRVQSRPRPAQRAPRSGCSVVRLRQVRGLVQRRIAARRPEWPLAHVLLPALQLGCSCPSRRRRLVHLHISRLVRGSAACPKRAAVPFQRSRSFLTHGQTRIQTVLTSRAARTTQQLKAVMTRSRRARPLRQHRAASRRESCGRRRSFPKARRAHATGNSQTYMQHKAGIARALIAKTVSIA